MRCEQCNRFLPGRGPTWAMKCQCAKSQEMALAEVDSATLALLAKRGLRETAVLAAAEFTRREVLTSPSCTEHDKGWTLDPMVHTTSDASTGKAERCFSCRRRVDYEHVLGDKGWAIWQALCRIPHHTIRARCGSITLRNYAGKASACHDGQCVHRVAINMATGEVVDGGYISTGECAINERSERSGKMDLTTCPTNVVVGWFKYAYGSPSLTLEVPDGMLAKL